MFNLSCFQSPLEWKKVHVLWIQVKKGTFRERRNEICILN